MTRSTPTRLGATAVLLCTIAPAALAQDTTTPPPLPLGTIRVQAPAAQAGAMSYRFIPGAQDAPPASDTAALLALVPGVALSRMSGHGIDIVIRGQQGNQINVINAGAFTYGGCPNRMDPPTSIANLSGTDQIVVERGYASVANGPGGSGGAVILKHTAPTFEDGHKVAGTLDLGATTNSQTQSAAGSIAVDLGHGFYLQGSAQTEAAGNYKDGSGNSIRSAYDQRSQGLTFGYKAGGADLAFDAEHNSATDVLFAGAGMDSPLDDNWVYRLRGGIDLAAGPLTRIEGNLFVSNVDHVMDNYTLRPAAGMLMRVPTTSDTRGGKLEGQFTLGTTKAQIGVDFQSNARTAIAYGGMAMARAKIDAADPTVSTFLMWPDVTIAQTGLYLQTETPLGGATTLKGGLRYDHVRASAGAARGLPGYTATAPDTYYTARYGTTFDTARTEDNLGGLLRLERQVTAHTLVFAGLSRVVRTADANERAMARNTWVGNPDIRPEVHNQFDLGFETTQESWSVNGSLFADRVHDFILRDQFSVTGVTTYRNVSALLTGLELSGNWARGGWEVGGDLAYTYGQDRTDDRPLAQIAPLMGKIVVSYGRNAWRAGARLNWAAGQHRIDPARDPGVTPGYATVDLFGTYDLSDRARLVAGVDNLLDKTYATALARSNTFDPTLVRVNEPGRTVYLKLQMKF